MTVGIALSSIVSPAPACSIEDAGGDAIDLSPIRSGEELLDWDGKYADFELIGSTRFDAGEYRAVCEGGVESAAASGVSFTVGRILGVDDVTDQIGAILGIFGRWGSQGCSSWSGLMLLIVGLVQRSRSGRSSAPTPEYPGQYPVSTRRALILPRDRRRRTGSYVALSTHRPARTAQRIRRRTSRPVPAAGAGPAAAGRRPWPGAETARSADRADRCTPAPSAPDEDGTCQVAVPRASAEPGARSRRLRSGRGRSRTGAKPYSSGAAG